jgi:hypothetical protein
MPEIKVMLAETHTDQREREFIQFTGYFIKGAKIYDRTYKKDDCN